MDFSWSDMQRQEDGRSPEGLAFTPGVDFDPFDPEEVEIIRLASEKDAASRISRLEAENARLRALLEEQEL